MQRTEKKPPQINSKLKKKRDTLLIVFIVLILITIILFASGDVNIVVIGLIFLIIDLFSFIGLDKINKDYMKNKNEVIDFQYSKKLKDDLIKNNGWKVIKKFAEKYRDYIIVSISNNVNYSYGGEEHYNNDLRKLKDLLKVKYNLSLKLSELIKVLQLLVYEIDEVQNKENYAYFKNLILSNLPKKKIEYVDALIANYGEDALEYNNVNFLHKLLEEKKIDNSKLGDLIGERKNKFELERFEHHIVNEEYSDEINFDLMDGYEFESFLGDLFRKIGYNVINTKLSGDQGADLIIERLGEKISVQAKCYSGNVGNKAIQEAVASKNHYNCNRAMVVVTSYFTRQAISLAKSNNVELWDRNKLDEMIEKYY